MLYLNMKQCFINAWFHTKDHRGVGGGWYKEIQFAFCPQDAYNLFQVKPCTEELKGYHKGNRLECQTYRREL